jgi:hypothetical protein
MNIDWMVGTRAKVTNTAHSPSMHKGLHGVCEIDVDEGIAKSNRKRGLRYPLVAPVPVRSRARVPLLSASL